MISSLGRRLSATLNGSGADDLCDIAHDLAHKLLVLAFAHDPDHRLRAGFPHQDPAASVQARLAVANTRRDIGILQRLAAGETYILEELPRRLEHRRRLAG